MIDTFTPKLITAFKEGYTRKTFISDLLAGVVIGVIALPLALAFASSSGVEPQRGLYTAIIAGGIIAILGGSRTQVSGPTGAFIPVVLGIVTQYGITGLATATFLAGLILFIMGIAKMGDLLRYIPYPVVVGFTSGIAFIILIANVKDFFGLTIDKVPLSFIDRISSYYTNFHTLDVNALLIGIISLIIVAATPRFLPKIPGALLALLITTVLVHFFGLNVSTIGSRSGAIPQMLPSPILPDLSFSAIHMMFGPALTIALLGSIESLLSAVVADGMTGHRHRPNMELVAQGIGNIISPIFSGIPATGAIARTAANIKNGAQTPVSAIVHSLTLFCIMVVFGKWVSLVPMPALAAILIFVAYNMSEWRTVVEMMRHPKSDVAILLTTLLLTVFIDLTVAIEAGMVLSAFLFLKRMEESVEVTGIKSQYVISEEGDIQDKDSKVVKHEVPDGVEMFEVYGPLFFGAVERFTRAIKRVEKTPKVVILRMRHVPFIDASGLRAIEIVHSQSQRSKQTLILSGVQTQPLKVLHRAGLWEKIGKDNIQSSTSAALERARGLLGISS